MSAKKQLKSVNVSEYMKAQGTPLLFCSYAGSIAYGLKMENSDVDIRGFYMPNARDILLGRAHDAQIAVPGTDTVLYSFPKFISLCRSNNPNILELLAVDRHLMLEDSSEYEVLRDNIAKIYSNKKGRRVLIVPAFPILPHCLQALLNLDGNLPLFLWNLLRQADG